VKKRRLPKKFVRVAVGVGLVLVALVGWLALVKPQQSKASKLETEIDSVRLEITQNRMLSRRNSPRVAVRLADVFRLTKAMPNDVDMPGILLELNRVAGATGITFQSITPQGEVSVSGYRMVPVEVIFLGNFYELSDLLYRLRNLVEVHRGELAATGRLFTVDSVHFSESPKHFPQLQATLTVNAFVYGGAGGAGAQGGEEEPVESTETAPASTENGSTTATPPAGATAAGVNP
jgi:Tfp pilus assembly protein PilO